MLVSLSVLSLIQIFCMLMRNLFEPDKLRPIDWTSFPPTVGGLECADGDRLRRLYKVQQKVPGYKSLVDSNATIFGTIDGKVEIKSPTLTYGSYSHVIMLRS